MEEEVDEKNFYAPEKQGEVDEQRGRKPRPAPVVCTISKHAHFSYNSIATCYKRQCRAVTGNSRRANDSNFSRVTDIWESKQRATERAARCNTKDHKRRVRFAHVT